MKILSWNCQGLGNPGTVRALKLLIANNNPEILFLMETKLTDTQFNFLKTYHDTYSIYTINCSMKGGGRAGGLAIMWNHSILNLSITSSDLNHIDMLISTIHNQQTWRATGIYGHPKSQNKFLTCQLINDLSCIDINPNWILFGDFNIVLNSNEKSGGNPLDPNITSSFRNTIDLCGLEDLGYNGSIFTWINRHQGDQLIKSRLDRFLANSNWISMFPYYSNIHLNSFNSDHRPILLNFLQVPNVRKNNPQHLVKRYEQIWATNDQHLDIVKQVWHSYQGDFNEKLAHTLNSLHKWGSKTFGAIPRRIKETQAELENLQRVADSQDLTQQISTKEKELDDLLEKEEMWWSQRSRALWLTHGDKNTRFFHQKASHRNKRNKIENIKDNQGVIHHDQDKIEEIFLSHFQQLFTSQTTHLVPETTQLVKNRLTTDMTEHLSKDFTADEVFATIKDLKSLAAPGPDGLPAKFYHNYWDIVGKEVTSTILHVLNHEGNPESLNSTHICLIPKTDKPTTPNEFRPISLCNVTLKIITKTIANRLKTILPDIISPNQSAFVPGRLISDNTLIANEVFHYLTQTTKQTGYVGIKTDMAKAYDRLEWEFIQATLEAMNFPQKLINTIMRCVTTVSFSILINGTPTSRFHPQRGLRQGDPLSPYLFIICVDVFSSLITNAQNSKLIHGVKIAPSAPEITHLFFADDSLMFCRANKEEATHMKALINSYQQASGQLVNYNKSEIIFSKKVDHNIKEEIKNILPMQEVNHFSKYLGQPTYIGRAKSQVFSYILDRVGKKLKGWKEKNLSFAGRATLIKAVAQAIPTYLMSIYLIPKGLCHKMESMISNFWWGSNVDSKKIHWTSWEKKLQTETRRRDGIQESNYFQSSSVSKAKMEIDD
jgi:exonuclease III